ncbi:MAG: sugar phosphate isomerase/epimerase family protein [Pirellulales bacterium]
MKHLDDLTPTWGTLMFPDERSWADYRLTRRAALGAAAAAASGAGVVLAQEAPREQPAANPPAPRFDMKKSINLWAFPYPDRMTLTQCLRLAKEAGFDGIELNYDLENDLSPKSETPDYHAIRRTADEIGIAISGVCSFLFWPYPLTSNDSQKRERALELAGKMTQAAHDLGTENLLVVPGAVHIPWRDDYEPVPNDVCDRRARAAIGKLLPQAEKLGVNLNIENIFFNGYLMTPQEMIGFVDSFHSQRLNVHFDTGNIMLFQFPEHWIKQLGKRIQNVHFKEFSKKGTDYSLESFRPLLDGTTNWPAVLAALDEANYRGYLTFEYFHPWAHYPEALVYQTSDSLDRMLGRDSTAATARV